MADQVEKRALPIMNSTSPSANPKEEMEFRLSLLNLLTVPHEGSASVSPSTASRQIEELSILVPMPRKADQTL